MEIAMAKTDKVHASTEAWESGKLGRDEKYARRADVSVEKALDEALGMQMISIRLQKKLIEGLKCIAQTHGIGYQPLIRQILTRFAVAEMKQILRDRLAETTAQEKKMSKASGGARELKLKKAA